MPLNAPWGAGKSSYFLLLRKFLKNPSALNPNQKSEGSARHKGWTVVEMNAWQHQHVGAPWWTLFQIIFDQLKAQSGTRQAKYKIIWQENWRRFHGRKLRFLVTASLALLGLLVIIFGGPGSELMAALFGLEFQSGNESLIRYLAQMVFKDGTLTSSGSITANLVALLLGLPAVGAGIMKSIGYFRETLMPGDAATAENWTNVHKDPRNQLKTHFQGLVDDLDKPLLIFIDDLDRCQPKYVVELLEHIMTIFRHGRVFFLVAADGQWITRCFELEYKEFKDYHSDPGRSLGHHFLEKVFQFSIPVPQASKELRDAFWRMLTQPVVQEVRTEEETAISADFNPVDNLASDTSASSDRDNAQREHQEKIEAFNRKSSLATNTFAREDTDKTVQSFLGPFSEHVENNPRAMKRLINAYIVQAIAETARYGRELDENEQVRLARWTILQHRYPILIDYFRNNPHKIRPVINHVAGTDTTAFGDDKRVQAILEQKNKIAHILKSPRTGQPTAIVLGPEDIADYLAVEI